MIITFEKRNKKRIQIEIYIKMTDIISLIRIGQNLKMTFLQKIKIC